MSLDIDQWRTFFAERTKGHSDLVAGYIRYLERCAADGLPPIFEERHLARLIGVAYRDLAFFLTAAPGRYRTFRMPKRRGGIREISVPAPLLLAMQRWILHNILYKMPMSDVAHGGMPGRSIISNASVHLGAEAVLRIDLKNFFDTVQLPLGVRIFEAAGYPPRVSRTLALLCFEKGRLPQGAATSPALANLAAISLDKRLTGLALKYKLNYTRYVDDLTFSGASIGMGFIAAVEEIISDCGFVINQEKTQLARGRSPKFVTGLSVGGSSLRVPRSFRRDLKNEAFQILKRGVQAHLIATDENDPLILERVLGKLAFWLQAEPESIAGKKYFEAISAYRKTLTTDVRLPEARRIAPLEGELRHMSE